MLLGLKFFKVTPLLFAVASLYGCDSNSSNSTKNTSLNSNGKIQNKVFGAVQANSYFPLQSGLTYYYEGVDDSGVDPISLKIEVEFTSNVRVINGVNTVEVIEREYQNSILMERSSNWFALDIEGTVWYLAESSTDYVDSQVEQTDEWVSGLSANAGIAMPSDPFVGQVFTKEDVLNKETETAEVQSLTESTTSPFGQFDNVLQISISSKTDPGEIDIEYYARNIGLVRIIEGGAGAVLDLIDVKSNLDETSNNIPSTVENYAEFKDMSLIFEQNATDEDAEIVLFLKGEDGFSELKIWSPKAQLVADFESKDLGNVGLAQITVESGEPSVDEVKEVFMEGVYTFVAKTVAGDSLYGQLDLSHALTDPSTINECYETIGADSVELTWGAVAGAAHYIVEVENDDLNFNLTVTLDSSTSSFIIPAGLLISGNEYEIGVSVSNEVGNLIVTECEFTVF